MTTTTCICQTTIKETPKPVPPTAAPPSAGGGSGTGVSTSVPGTPVDTSTGILDYLTQAASAAGAAATSPLFYIPALMLLLVVLGRSRLRNE